MKLESYLRKRLEQKPICVMTHVIAGYPSFEENLQALELMARHNVDVVEIQMPFSEPTADGPVFVRANQKSLESGTTVEQYFHFMQRLTTNFDFPVLMMGYYNTIFKMGEAPFIQRLKNAGGCGLIVPDLPVDVGTNLYQLAKQNDLAPIAFMTPTSSDERLRQNGQAGSGFIYVVARKGVTGEHTDFKHAFQAYLKRCRQATQLPLAVGFGVSARQDLSYLAGQVEMAIIGTAVLEIWEQSGRSGLNKFLADIQLT